MKKAYISKGFRLLFDEFEVMRIFFEEIYTFQNGTYLYFLYRIIKVFFYHLSIGGINFRYFPIRQTIH